jgi:polyphosphate kinase
MNSLVDPGIIEALYEATKRGVEIDLVVRGICCLNPEAAPGPGKIRVVSIIDRYLEHTRVYYFRNGGNEEYYLSSADWMPRNLDKRIESLFPVEDENTKEILATLLDFQLNDKARARIMEKDGAYVKITSDPESRSQKKTAEFFKNTFPAPSQPGKLLKYRPAR